MRRTARLDGGDDIHIERAKQIEGPPKWAVRQMDNCLNKQGEWEYEPMPSSRDDDFLARCRFDSPEEAFAALGVALPATASAWWALVMGAAASIEDAANCLRDPDAKKQADGAAKHYREAAQKLWAASGVTRLDGETFAPSVPSVLPPMSGLSGEAKT